MVKIDISEFVNINWTYSAWVCCKCRETNEKTYCWKCGHQRCNSCQDGW